MRIFDVVCDKAMEDTELHAYAAFEPDPVGDAMSEEMNRVLDAEAEAERLAEQACWDEYHADLDARYGAECGEDDDGAPPAEGVCGECGEVGSIENGSYVTGADGVTRWADDAQCVRCAAADRGGEWLMGWGD